MKEIFISYSTIDTTQAETVRNILENNGFSCWMAPRDIPGGSNYTKEIPIAIRNCKVFLLVLSTHSQSSHWVLKELDAAVNNAKVILPFMVEEFDLNDEFNFLLSGTQRYTAYQKKADAIESLINRVRAIVDADRRPEETTQDEIPQENQKQPTPAPAAPAPAKPIFQLEDASCPACHCADLKPLPHKFKLAGGSEIIFKFIPALMGVAGFILGALILGFLPLSSGGMFWGLVVFVVLGVVIGNRMAAKKVNNHRLRKGTQVTCYRCNRCKKVFNYTKNLE